MFQSARAAVPKSDRPGSSNNITFIFSQVRRPEVQDKVPTGFVSPKPLAPACRVLMWSFFFVHVSDVPLCVPISSHEDTGQIG